MSKYGPLTAYLLAQPAETKRMSFADIEAVLGRTLPSSAMSHRAWWSNNPQNNVMTQAWIDAGFQTEQVDLPGRTLVFRRIAGASSAPGFAEAPQPTLKSDKLGLFGWMQGTIVIADGATLTGPADPAWSETSNG